MPYINTFKSKAFNIVNFAVTASTAKAAATKAIQFPRVKHDHPDAIVDVKRITYLEFINLIKENENNEYLTCNSRYEQNLRCPEVYLYTIKDSYYKEYHDYYDRVEDAKQKRLDRINYHMRKDELKNTVYRADYEY